MDLAAMQHALSKNKQTNKQAEQNKKFRVLSYCLKAQKTSPGCAQSLIRELVTKGIACKRSTELLGH